MLQTQIETATRINMVRMTTKTTSPGVMGSDGSRWDIANWGRWGAIQMKVET